MAYYSLKIPLWAYKYDPQEWSEVQAFCCFKTQLQEIKTLNIILLFSMAEKLSKKKETNQRDQSNNLNIIPSKNNSTSRFYKNCYKS